ELNPERRYIEADMQHQAMQELTKLHLENKKLPAGLCLFDENWHQGVIGILAGRIKDRYHRPVIVFALGNDTEIKGSARSIEGIHIRDILDGIATKYPDLISKFGGHAMAAGLTIKKEHFSQFSEAFNQEILLHIDENIFQSILHSDGELEKEHFTLDLAQVLKDGGPWGHHFAEPLFDGTFELLEQRLVGQKHLKMTVRQNDLLLDAIAFNVDLEKWPNHRCSMVNLAYRLDINEFRGIRTLQLLVEHLEPCA
ncbi:MAG: DHHA1 domain-containing protein, partial [Gammaproteobacteria bacterium]